MNRNGNNSAPSLDGLLRMRGATGVRSARTRILANRRTTEYGLQVAFEQMEQDFGALARLAAALRSHKSLVVTSVLPGRDVDGYQQLGQPRTMVEVD